jgi:hypothetical protein
MERLEALGMDVQRQRCVDVVNGRRVIVRSANRRKLPTEKYSFARMGDRVSKCDVFILLCMSNGDVSYRMFVPSEVLGDERVNISVRENGPQGRFAEFIDREDLLR